MVVYPFRIQMSIVMSFKSSLLYFSFYRYKEYIQPFSFENINERVCSSIEVKLVFLSTVLRIDVLYEHIGAKLQ